MTYYGTKKVIRDGVKFAALELNEKTKKTDKFTALMVRGEKFVARRNDGVLFKGFRNESGAFMMGNDDANPIK